MLGHFKCDAHTPILEPGQMFWSGLDLANDAWVNGLGIRWPHFLPGEIASSRSHVLQQPKAESGPYPALREDTVILGNGSLLLTPAAMDALHDLRELCGKPLIINSGYRDPEYNHYIGGEPGSYHMQGKAFDISHANLWLTDDDRLAAFLALGRRCGFRGFGLYDDFTHMDIGPKRYWDFRTKKSLSKDLEAFLSKVKK